MIPPARLEQDGRIAELDAIRGLASLSVVLFHYTFRYDRLFTAEDGVQVGAAWEWLRAFGVPVFFIISGLMIPRTIDRSMEAGAGWSERRAGVWRFVVGRFARLYPAFWCAAALTFATVAALGLHGRGVTSAAAAANLTMIPQALGAAATAVTGERVRFPYIDGVYWSLEVELKFYALVGVLALAGLRRWLHWALALLVVIDMLRPEGVLRGAVEFVDGRGVARSLQHMGLARGAQVYFLTGVLIHEQRRARAAGRARWWIAPLMALCLVKIFSERDGPAAAVYVFNTCVIWAAANYRLRPLVNPVLLFLGTISYGMFLLHQNIGYIVMGRLLGAGWSRVGATMAAIAIAVALATALTFGVEHPCRRAIRGRFIRPRVRPA